VWTHSDLRRGYRLGKPDSGRSGDRLYRRLESPDTGYALYLRTQLGHDDASWRRGRAWALSIALVALPYYIHTNQQITAWARYTIRQVADEFSELIVLSDLRNC